MFVLLWQLTKQIAVWAVELMESGFHQVFLQFPYVSLNDLSFVLCHIVLGEGQWGAEWGWFWLSPPSVGVHFWISVLYPTSGFEKNLKEHDFQGVLKVPPLPSALNWLTNGVRCFWLGRGLGSQRGQAGCNCTSFISSRCQGGRLVPGSLLFKKGWLFSASFRTVWASCSCYF